MENDQTPNNGGQPAADQTGKDGTVNLKGQKDEHGIPLDPEEARDYYKDKFANSTRGAQELLSEKERLAKEKEELERKLQQNPDQKHNEDFVPRSEFEETKQKLEAMEEKNAYEENRKLVSKEISDLVNQEEFKPLQGHKKALLDYAYKEGNVGAALATLARAFMVENNLIVPAKKEEEPRPGMEGDSGSTRNSEPRGDGYTSEEAEDLRKNDPKKYARLIREGKMNIVDK